jgi:cell division protein FtsQ
LKRKRRARVKVTTSRAQAAAEFSRKKVRQRRRAGRRRLMGMVAAAFVVYLVVGGWWLHHTGRAQHAAYVTSNAFWQMTADGGFALNQVYLTGREHTDADMVKAALGVKPGMPILSLSLAEMQKRLENIPEIKSATIERQLPGTLKVALTERTPAVLWQHDGTYSLVDENSIVLSQAKYPNAGPLPLVVGEDAPQHVAEILALLDAAPTLKGQVVAAVRVGQRRWNMQMQRGIVVMLPEEEPQAAWLRFAGLVDREGLLTRAIRSVDMRLEDRVFIMPLEQQAPPITLTSARDT